MGKLVTGKGYIRVTVSPEQVLHWTNHGKDVTDTLRTEAWRVLVLNDPKKVVGRTFKYGDVEVLDGEFSITFFEGIPEKLPSPPRGP